jgi:hypothetical protein
MDLRRLRIDLFAFALGALVLLSLFFYGTRNGAALLMCALCFAGLVVARMAGFSNLALVPLALGVVVLLWFDPPAEPQRTSALVHGVGGALVGWALAESLRARLAWPAWAVVALASVAALTVLWELGELVGDRVLETALIPDARDSALDISFGILGGATAIGLARLLPRRPQRS